MAHRKLGELSEHTQLRGCWWRGRGVYFYGGRRTLVQPKPISPKDKNAGRYESKQQHHGEQ
jgi:hypothetical protein